jgi:RNA polymerase sigma factor (sigma-70 family)
MVPAEDAVDIRVAALEAQTVSADDARSQLIERIFREHNEALLRFLALRVRSQQAAKDIAQEAYVRLLQLDQPGAVSYLRAFLFKTAANLAVDHIRHEQTARRIKQTKLFEALTAPSTPEQSTDGAQELRLVERLIAQLPPKCRRAFLLHRVGDLDISDIALQMGLSERMVRTYVVRALVYCRTALEAARKAAGRVTRD